MSISLFKIDEAIEQLLNESIDRETGEISDEALEELELLEGERDKKALAVAAYVAGLLAEADAVKATAAKLTERARKHTAQAERLRQYLELHSEPGKKLSDDKVRIVWRKSKAVTIDDPAKLPEEYLRRKAAPPPEPDKVKIKAELAEGKEVPGASLEHRVKVAVEV